MIQGNCQSQRANPKILVENKITFAGPDTELGIYDTYAKAERVALASDQLLFCGMVTGKKIMHSSDDDFETAFHPHESFVMAPNQAVEIDFPEAKLNQPTTCLAIEISTERISQISDSLNAQSPLNKTYGDWYYRHHMVHTHHNHQTQALLARIVQIFTENHPDRSCMIDLAISELTIRLLRHQTRDFLLHHVEQTPDDNGLNAAIHFIHQHLAETLNIDDLCRLACMSRTKFFQQFKHHLGCTPGAYQHQVRLQKAASLIRQKVQITQVAFQLGFKSQSHFSRCFKQFFGLCPRQFKDRNLDS